MKHKNSYVKKCIAGVLTIALAAGVCQSYGSIEASAQEMTLPGIQQLVQEKQTQGETFHILEIVADKSNAVWIPIRKKAAPGQKIFGAVLSPAARKEDIIM